MDWDHSKDAARALSARPRRQYVAHLATHLLLRTEAWKRSQRNKGVGGVVHIYVGGEERAEEGGVMDGEGPWSSARRTSLRMRCSASSSI